MVSEGEIEAPMKITLACIIGLTLTFGVCVSGDGPITKPAFQLQAVKRTSVPVTVQAFGQLQPANVVEVGAPVAGTIQKFGTDPNNKNKSIDYNSVVKEGTILAQID